MEENLTTGTALKAIGDGAHPYALPALIGIIALLGAAVVFLLVRAQRDREEMIERIREVHPGRAHDVYYVIPHFQLALSPGGIGLLVFFLLLLALLAIHVANK